MANARERILDAADELFGELGFDATATRQIAERCDVNKALIHYHFETKERLFHAVLDRYYARLAKVVQIGVVGESDLRGRLVRLLDAYVDFLVDNQRFSRMLQREVASGRHVEQIVTHMVPPFRAAVASVQGTFPASQQGDLEAAHLLVSFYGMIVTWFTFAPVTERLLGVDPLSQEQIAHRKRHLLRMLDLAIDALDAEAPGA